VRVRTRACAVPGPGRAERHSADRAVGRRARSDTLILDFSEETFRWSGLKRPGRPSIALSRGRMPPPEGT